MAPIGRWTLDRSGFLSDTADAEPRRAWAGARLTAHNTRYRMSRRPPLVVGTAGSRAIFDLAMCTNPPGITHFWRATRTPDASVMAHLWRIRVRSWTFALVCRVVDLPFLFADVRRIRLDDFPKLITTSRTLDCHGISHSSSDVCPDPPKTEMKRFTTGMPTGIEK